MEGLGRLRTDEGRELFNQYVRENPQEIKKLVQSYNRNQERFSSTERIWTNGGDKVYDFNSHEFFNCTAALGQQHKYEDIVRDFNKHQIELLAQTCGGSKTDTVTKIEKLLVSIAKYDSPNTLEPDNAFRETLKNAKEGKITETETETEKQSKKDFTKQGRNLLSDAIQNQQNVLGKAAQEARESLQNFARKDVKKIVDDFVQKLGFSASQDADYVHAYVTDKVLAEDQTISWEWYEIASSESKLEKLQTVFDKIKDNAFLTPEQKTEKLNAKQLADLQTSVEELQEELEQLGEISLPPLPEGWERCVAFLTNKVTQHAAGKDDVIQHMKELAEGQIQEVSEKKLYSTLSFNNIAERQGWNQDDIDEINSLAALVGKEPLPFQHVVIAFFQKRQEQVQPIQEKIKKRDQLQEKIAAAQKEIADLSPKPTPTAPLPEPTPTSVLSKDDYVILPRSMPKEGEIDDFLYPDSTPASTPTPPTAPTAPTAPSTQGSALGKKKTRFLHSFLEGIKKFFTFAWLRDLFTRK